MENVIFAWASSQSWWGIATTIIVVANGIANNKNEDK